MTQQIIEHDTAQPMAVPQPNQPLAPVSDTQALINVIAQASRDPSVDVDKMRGLMEIRKELAAEEAERAFNIAMSRVQSHMRRIGTDRTNTQTNSQYATYAKLDSVLRPLYTAEGFALSFTTEPTADIAWVRVICFVTHDGGHTRRYGIDMPADGKGAKGGDVMTKTHATGSATAYGMRYLLKMIFNIAIGAEEGDDDGNGATTGDTPDTKAADWIRTADQLQTLAEYNATRAKMVASYKGKVKDIPVEVKSAFAKALAAVTPKDVE